MSAELITYGSDRRCELAACEAIRPMVYLDDWTTIRIGLQLSFNGTASNITSTPVLAFGVCSGNTNVMAAGTATHVVGWRNTKATLTYAAGPPSTLVGSTAAMQFFKKIGTTFSVVNGSSMVSPYSNTTSVRSGLWMDITKGSPNYSFRIASPSNAAAAQSDLTDAQFLSIMELSTLADIATVRSDHVVSSIASVLAVDEATNGLLDHLFVYWDRTTHKFSFNIRHRKIS